MKKIILSIFVTCFQLFTFAQTIQVTREEAVQAASKAIQIIHRDFSNHPSQVSGIFEKRFGNNVALYEIQYESGEHVIISGSKAARPILALYNESDGYSWLQNIEERESGFAILIESMYQKIGRSFSVHCVINDGWNSLDSSTNYNTRNQYGPYLSTLWGQRRADNCYCKNMYNKYMPYSDGDCECNDTIVNYPSGCTVTALAQLMNYWQHPVLINHVEQIDWCNMPQKIKCGESLDIQNEAVARLYKLLGDKLGTSYGSLFGSRNDIDRCYGYLNPAFVVHDLHDFFDYSDNIDVIVRASPIYYLDSNRWEAKIKREIIDGKPVLYWAFQYEERNESIGGAHTFVCDGYDAATRLFHFNWGHRNSGWCSINYIAEDSTIHWRLNECAMIKIKPASHTDICNANLSLGTFYDAYYHTHIANYNSSTPSQFLNPAPYLITPQTMTSLTSASNVYREDFRTIPSGVWVIYQAHEEIVLRDGFTAKRGSDFTARIEPCERCEERARVDTEKGTMATNGHTRDGNDDTLPRYIHAQSLPVADVYPNPTDRMLTVATGGEVEAIVIYTLDGRPLGGWKLLSLGGGSATLDVSTLADGTYILTVRLADGTIKATKFIKKE
ncbi:MAG: C10 family peptidase [Bacteroidales bacterium]|nr:C10 family peptidase [Bacteroidales bacterium]